MAGRAFIGEITSIDSLPGGAALISISCSAETAAQARAGQFIQITCRSSGSLDPFLRQSFFLFGASVREATLTIVARPDTPGSRWLAGRRQGDPIELTNPAGNSFTISPTTRNALLLAPTANASSLAMLASDLLERKVDVTLLIGADSDSDLISPIDLPSGVEVIAATRDGSRGHAGVVTDLLPEYARWADQVFSEGTRSDYRPLIAALQPHRIAKKPTMQVAVDDHLPCGFGVCNGCPVATRHGTVLNCVRGPVFDADELV